MSTSRVIAMRGLAAGLTALALLGPVAAAAQGASGALTLEKLGTYATGIFDGGAAEIVAHDPATQRLFVVNGAASAIDVLDIGDPRAPVKLFAIDVTPWGAAANSVAARAGLIAAAVEADPKTDPGRVVVFDAAGTFLRAVPVGALPDMVTFSPDGRWLLVANEGEPSDDYAVDPEGSVTIADLRGGVAQATVATADFRAWDRRPLPAGVRVFGPGASPSQDLEPEFIAVSPNGRRAWVTLQENNALALVDVPAARVVGLFALGTKDHLLPGRGLDASDRDGRIAIERWPVAGMYMPDAIAAFRARGATYLVTANEGDARDYGAFAEEERIGDLTLDPTAFPDAAALQDDAALGRLNVSTVGADPDGDGDVDRLFAFGARSFAIWTPAGHLVHDSGEALERITGAAFPAEFNSDNTENDSLDSRSDNKGPEPEGLAVARLGGRPILFLGLERIGGIALFDLSDPTAPAFLSYVNNRDFSGDPEQGTAGDLGPEGLLVIAARDSPIGEPLLAVANEVSGTTTIFRIAAE